MSMPELVEFANDEGRTYAMADPLVVLHRRFRAA
jgi:hypothetical protein